MAFTRTTGKHRRTGRLGRSTAYVAGVAALAATGVIGGLTATPATAAQRPAEGAGLTRVLAGAATADRISAQAAAQRHAAYEAAARRTAELKAERKAVETKRKAEAAKRRAVKRRTAKMRAARAAVRRSVAYTVPIIGSYVTTGYRTGGSLWSSGSHTGIDFHAATGTPVHAVGTGTVVEAGWGGAYGNNIVLRMHDGTYTQYGHLSTIAVTAGQSVAPGQRIALSGATGNATGPHLHFEARTTPDYGSDIDPVAYLRSHGVKV
ncbi:M23 family metallopeptidase [Streptomyces sp. TS71-3]|uniref:M23 family metallopeptidase n=1 Tax=Streptomyces sp. TS71-3 TaxID=2733862 RepID=UPI001AFFD8BD|nr:M23 family metallopeptidase [Streptomyces sp. TS71-3]GHJ40631.1 peptidase [Streptomyces sp. TS71-3]